MAASSSSSAIDLWIMNPAVSERERSRPRFGCFAYCECFAYALYVLFEEHRTMARMRKQPTIATDEEVRMARKASEALEAPDAASQGLRVQVSGAGGKRRTLDL